MTPFLERYSLGCGQPGRDWFHPLSGWFLAEVMKLDHARPGLLRHATEAPPLWRNAVATALSTGVRHQPETFLLRANGYVDDGQTAEAQVAEAMMSIPPGRTLEAALGEVPTTLAGTLKKIGSTLLNTPDGYVRLVGLLRCRTPESRARRKVLEQINERLDDDLIQTVQTLRLVLLTPRSAVAVRTASEAHAVNARLDVIRQVCSTATDDALRQSIDRCPAFQSGSWVRSWLAKADRLPPLGIPLDDEPSVKRIMPADSSAVGREWRNCLGGHARIMATGATSYFAIDDLSVVVLLTNTDGGWLLSGIHGRSNMPVPSETTRKVKERLSPLGVVCLIPSGPPPELMALSGAFIAVNDMEFEFDGMTI